MIVEPNFKIYALTSQLVYRQIIAQIIDIESEFPNMITGSITREKCRESFKKGLTTDQICMFLNEHAHPKMYDLTIFKNSSSQLISGLNPIKEQEEESKEDIESGGRAKLI